MQRFYMDRESYGPEFDDRLIRLVRENPAIYDVNHEHYRRNPVRVAIWDRIATELGAPSKFLQTKWKNIRYNYLQEIKCLETGHTNSNIRKRRFTEDLSFLQHTAQTYRKGMQKNSSYNGSDNDNDSSSYLYPDSLRPNAFEVIEIEHSDDGSHHEFIPDCSLGQPDQQDDDADEDNKLLAEATLPNALNNDDSAMLQPEVTIEQRSSRKSKSQPAVSIKADTDAMTEPITKLSPAAYPSNPSSPLLTPLVVMGNGEHEHNGEITIEPIPKQYKESAVAQRIQRQKEQAAEIMANAAKRKSMPAPFPVLTPINDPIELYCLSLVDSLRNMPRSERERVKFEFAKILKDAKYKDQS